MAICYIYRMPNIKALKPHLFGQTLSLVFVCISIAFFWQIIGSTVTILSMLAIFGLAVIIGWLSLIIIIVLLIIFGVSGLSPTPDFGESFLFFARAYLVGYLFGAIFSIVYNLILNLSIKIIGRLREDRNLIFAYEDENDFNVMKSPRAIEEIQLDPRHQRRRIYQYNFPQPPAHPSPPNHPFTIAFIASPYYMRWNNGAWEPTADPIMNDERLFYRSVGNALEVFEKDEVLGAPEIWSRVRIVTIFNQPNQDQNSIDYTFVGGSSYVYNEPLLGYDDIISPISFMDDPAANPNTFRQTLQARFPFLDKGQQQIMNKADIIYYLTANTDYIRSSARPSSGADPGYVNQPYNLHGQNGEHEGMAEVPGLVALNVIYARQKTYIHEFGHAMAHATNGCIVDEYHDRNVIENVIPINCLLKNPPNIAVPKPFGGYEFPFLGGGRIDFHSDRDHPSNAEHWQSYFPRREAKDIGCIMDRTIGPYQFDRLLSNFMYDRLITKLIR